MKTRSVGSRKVQFAFGSAILALLVVGAVSYRSILVSSESDRWVQHSYQVLDDLNSLLAAMESVEASYRGFALTGDESHFDSYRISVANAMQSEKVVRELTVDNPVQQLRLPTMENLMAEKIHFDDTVIQLRRTKGLEAVGDALRSGSGQRIMNRFQAMVHDMQIEELRLLSLRNAVAKRRLEQTRIVLFLGTAIGLLIAVGAGWGARSDHSARELAEDAQREGDELFGNVVNNISQLAWMADDRFSVFWYNDRWFEYCGVTQEELAGLGWKKVVHPDCLNHLVEGLDRCILSGETWEDTFPLRGKDGRYRMFLGRAVPILDAKGRVLRWVGTDTDITELQGIKGELFAEKERAQVTLNSIGDAVVCTDLAGNISFFNPVAEKMTGLSLQEAEGRPMTDFIRIVDAASRVAIPNPTELAIVDDGPGKLVSNCLLIQPDGAEIPIENSISPIHDRKGEVIGAVIVFRDVSATLAMQREMIHAAQHDFLTGLPNRMLLNELINHAIGMASRHRRRIAVLFLDLDGFKHINDSLGHRIGDKLIQSTAQRLTDCVRGSDSVSRQGGDEFVVLLSETGQIEDAAITAKRMLQAVAMVHRIDDYELHVTASIGISVYPGDGLDSETLIKNADTAMYHAKELGRQRHRFFEPAMNTRAVVRRSIEEGLRRALERREMVLHYQPKVDLKTGEITGAEALIRWEHPARGMISPAEFIPVAEDSGLILPIGNWVLRESCRQARRWLDEGLLLNSVAVNVSAIEFRDRHFLQGILEILEETGLEPNVLQLELTESVLMKTVESTESILKTLRTMGVKVAIDDFGTGYSSLSYLRKFPADFLKIDQSFIRQLTTAPEDTSIVTAIISMAGSLKMRVIAEGVEMQEEMAFLQANGCDEAQGYYFSRPIVPEQFAQLLKTGLSTFAALS